MLFDGEGKEAVAALAAELGAAGTILPFTGAGISTECGIPDFRSPGGLWTQNKPIDFQTFVSQPEARREAWRRRFAMDAAFEGAVPGRGHRALARLVASGRAPAIITQNIDDLHQAAGVPRERVIELHGNTTFATCLTCGSRHELAPIRRRFAADGIAPDCETCGGVVKTATISFGQPMPRAAMEQATRLARSCDLFLAIGSSLVVYPAAGLPLVAREAGARLAVINREATPLDPVADLIIRADIGPLLERAIHHDN